MQEIWENSVQLYKQALAHRNENTTTGSAYNNIDWERIQELSFLNNYIENRPVESTMCQAQPSVPRNSAARLGVLEEQRALHQKPQDIWQNPAFEQEKLTPYLQSLPPSVPKFDGFAEKKRTYATDTWQAIHSLGRKLDVALDRHTGQRNDIKGAYKKVLALDVQRISETFLPDFFEEASAYISASIPQNE